MSIAAAKKPSLRVPSQYGTLARFNTPEELVAAARKAHVAGYRRMDGYSPIPIEGLADALGRGRTVMPLIVLVAGIVGGLTAFAVQWFSAVVDYPYNVGGRPFNSWPSFIPITFELTVLFAAGSGVLGMLFLNGLPRPNHPIFNAPGIERATTDRFFLCIESSDPKWSQEDTRRFMENELHSIEVKEVER